MFPVNIKPFTTLWYLHNIGGYSQLSHWALVLLLSRFSAQELQQIDIAWYGNRINGYPESSVPQPLLPTSCPICNHQLQLFFNLYMQCVTGEQRAVLLRKINCTDSFNCSCRERFLSTLVQTDFPLLHSQVYMQQRRLVAALKGDFPDYFSRL